MRPILRRLAFIALPALILLLPGSAVAFPLTNCTVTLTSLDANGAQIDTATDGDTDGTRANPLLVDWDGSVEWAGTMGELVITDHTWGVSVFYVPTPESGSDANEDGETDGNGTVQVSDTLPFKVTGLFYVSGQISGTGGSCEGNGWVRLRGEAFGTIPFWLGLGLIVVGLLLMWAGYRRGWGWAVVGGFLLGLGAAVMLIIYGVMLVGSWTPPAALGIGLVLGIVVAFLKPETY